MSSKPNYDEVPSDYPYYEIRSSVAGYQSKLPMRTASDGKFYIPGNTPEERWHDWQYSMLFAEALAAKCLESKSGKRAHMTEEQIISQYYVRAISAGGRYGSKAQLAWSFRKIAELLGWPLPKELANV